MKPVRVGVVCDLREEGWHSMDLVADMLLDTLPSVSAGSILATRLRPPMIRRWTRLPVVGGGSRAHLGDRLTGRLWDYPRWLRPRRGEFDVFHIVDHSYAHLIRALPADRTIITCNDTDAFEAARDGAASRFDPARLLAAHVLDGISRASHVACISEATRQDLISTGRVDPSRTSVVYLGAHPACTPAPDAVPDAEIDRQLGTRTFEVLHVSSTIPRKRIDVLLEVFSAFRRMRPDARLVRVGGPLTREQHASCRTSEYCRRACAAAISGAAAAGRVVPPRLDCRAAIRARRFWIAGRRSDGLRHACHCQRHTGAARSRRSCCGVLLRPVTSDAG